MRRPLLPAALATLACAVLAAAALARSSAASGSSLALALDAAVRISGQLQVWREGATSPELTDWHDSGWTASCRPDGDGYLVEVQTAAHVLDILEVLREDHAADAGPFRLQADFQVLYRDGAHFRSGPGDVAWGEGDSATLSFRSPGPRACLPTGDPELVKPGDSLRVVGCPGRFDFAVGEGVLALRSPDGGLWLSTVPVAPGSSGAPVLDGEGHVVAQVLGLVQWPWGTLAVLQPVGGRP